MALDELESDEDQNCGSSRDGSSVDILRKPDNQNHDNPFSGEIQVTRQVEVVYEAESAASVDGARNKWAPNAF